MKTNKPSIKAVISTIVGIAIIIVIIYVAYLSNERFEKTVVSQTQQKLLAIVRVAAKGLDEFIIHHQESLKVLSNDPLIKEQIYNKVQWKKEEYGEKFCQIENLYNAHKKHVNALTIIDANGKMLDRDPFWKDNKNRIGWDYSDKPGVAYVLREHKPCVSEVFYNDLGNLAVSISEPVFYKDKFAGIVRWMIEIDRISEHFIEPVKIGKKGFIWMFDDKNTVISHPRKDFIGTTVLDVIKKTHNKRGETFDESRTKGHIIAEHDYLNRVVAKDEGFGIFIDCVTDELDIIAYKRVAAGNLILNLIATLPYSEITGPINKHAREIFGLAGLVIMLLGAGGLALFRSQKEKARLEIEARYLKQIANGAEALRKSEEKFREFVEGTDDLVTRVDSNGRFTYVNDTSEKIFGLSPEECIGLSAFDFIHPDDREKTKAAFAEWVRNRISSTTFKNRQVSRTGQVHHMHWTINPHFDEDGNLTAINSIASDFTDLKLAEDALVAEIERRTEFSKQLEEANAQLKRLTLIDGLTGIANRWHFDEFIEKEWHRNMRDNKPIALIMGDIDFFKNYNDTYGHQAGDDCLKQVAAILNNIAKRPGDLAARYGGEEFAVILSGTDLKQAGVLAENANKKLKQTRIPHSDSQAADYVTLSLGVASIIPRHGTKPYDLIKAADKALYKAKNSGRNCMCDS